MRNATELVAPLNQASRRGCDHSDAWLQALMEATACLRDGQATTEDLDHCSLYLNELEAALRTKEDRWDFPPSREPPLWKSSRGGNETASNGINHKVRRMTGVNNRFATFQHDDSDSDDESLSSRSEDDEAGDCPVLNREPHDHNDAPYAACMDMRRLMIRILNAQSDVFAAKALLFRKQSPPAWTVGAEQYTRCLHKIHAALILADSEISKWIAADTVDDSNLLVLTEDANIVEVSVQSMTVNRESYLSAARRHEAYLVRKLQQQWQSRDVVNARMGDRWVQNEPPKNYYASRRAEREKSSHPRDSNMKWLRDALLLEIIPPSPSLASTSSELHPTLDVIQRITPCATPSNDGVYRGWRDAATKTSCCSLPASFVVNFHHILYGCYF
jgi:hypothetical protein